jgi:flagellar hook-associated protein 2
MGAGAASVAYNAAGTLITVTSDQTLNDIASAINKASYATDAGVSASVVNNRLVVSAQSTGLAHAIQLADVTGTVLSGTGSSGLGLITAPDTFKNTTADTGYQAPSDAVFTVNGMQVTRDRNSGLSGIITGITLNLAEDAVGQSATITVSTDTSTVKTKITAFLDALNALQSHIRSQTAVTSFSSGEDTVYTRNALSGDNTILTALRNSLFASLYGTVSGLSAGAPTNLRQIGITLDSNLTAQISSSSALEAALAADPKGVEALIEGLMTKMENVLSPFTGTSGIVNGKITATNGQIRNINTKIANIEARLEDRQTTLERQYAYLQVQLAQISYTQTQLGMLWGWDT